MTISMLIIALGFIWLGYETDWLRIRLPIGKLTIYQYRTWDDIMRTKPPYKYLPNFLKMDGYEPLCGWDWLKNTMHIVPENRIEMTIGNVRYKMTIKAASVLNEVMKVNHLTKKQKLAYMGT